MMDNEQQFAKHRLKFAQRRLLQYISRPESQVPADAFVDALQRVQQARRQVESLTGAGRMYRR